MDGGCSNCDIWFLISLLSADQLKLESLLIKGVANAFGLSIVCAVVVLGDIPWALNRKPVLTSIQSAPIANWLLVN